MFWNTMNNSDKEKVTYSKEECTTLVLSAPSIDDKYYKKVFQDIVNFQIAYAKKVIDSGIDEVRICVDNKTRKFYENKGIDDVLLNANIDDIWMRDFTTVNPENPVQFIYTHASMSKEDSKRVQKSFTDFADEVGFERRRSSLILDGGNIVDNHAGMAITTTRFLEDNDLSYQEGKEELAKALDAKHVAIIEPDDEILAHSDGMTAFIDENTLLLYKYDDKEFDKNILDELQNSLPGVKIITLPLKIPENIEKWPGFESAYGINLNLVYTKDCLYVPTFSLESDKEVLKLIEENTDKKVVSIDATKVAKMGGSVRCLTWQVKGNLKNHNTQ